MTVGREGEEDLLREFMGLFGVRMIWRREILSFFFLPVAEKVKGRSIAEGQPPRPSVPSRH